MLSPAVSEELPAWMQAINTVHEQGFGNWVSKVVQIDSVTSMPALKKNLGNLMNDQFETIDKIERNGKLDSKEWERGIGLRFKDIVRDQLPTPVSTVVEWAESAVDAGDRGATRIKNSIGRINDKVDDFLRARNGATGIDVSNVVDVSSDEREWLVRSRTAETIGLPDSAISEIVEFERVQEQIDSEQLYFRDPTDDGYFDERRTTYALHEERLKLPSFSLEETTGCYEAMPGWSVKAGASGFTTCVGTASSGTAPSIDAADMNGPLNDTVIRSIGDETCSNVTSGNWSMIRCDGSGSSEDPSLAGVLPNESDDELLREAQALIDQTVERAESKLSARLADRSGATQQSTGGRTPSIEVAPGASGYDSSECKSIRETAQANAEQSRKLVPLTRSISPQGGEMQQLNADMWSAIASASCADLLRANPTLQKLYNVDPSPQGMARMEQELYSLPPSIRDPVMRHWKALRAFTGQ